MFRVPNTTVQGASFPELVVQAVWQKGNIVPGVDPARRRKDCCGAWIDRFSYGSTGDLGWEIDHVLPVSQGGPDDLYNLQPLQWRNNRHKGDDWPGWSAQ
jgi:hypothetical protein